MGTKEEVFSKLELYLFYFYVHFHQMCNTYYSESFIAMVIAGSPSI